MLQEDPDKQAIMAQLRQQILLREGFKPATAVDDSPILAPIRAVFPNHCFPLAGLHEFIFDERADAAASSGFIASILSSIMKSDAVCVWISSSRMVFPHGLKAFGIEPHKVIFITVDDHKKKLWAIEESLKFDGLSAVVGEVAEISFVDSRRFQLAIEKSGVPAFVLRQQPKNLRTASMTRWRITAIDNGLANGMPGLGFPTWQVELLKLKARNGTTGRWHMQWRAGQLQLVNEPAVREIEQHQRKAG